MLKTLWSSVVMMDVSIIFEIILFGPFYGTTVSFSTSQLSETTFSHHVCHDVVNNRSGVMKVICAKGNVDRTQCLAVTLTS